MKISIIIPVYNVECYIKEMLDSVLNQTLNKEEYEIIVIDDKSTDMSYKLLKDYEHKIDVLMQNEINIGLGATRNKGFELSRSKYVMFLDSDDILVDNALENLLNAIDKSNSDIAQGNYKRFNTRWESLCVNKNLFSQEKVTTLSETPELLLELTAWNKLYKKSFLKDISFQWEENRLYEDMYPNLRAFYLAEKIHIIEDVVYMWRVRENTKSITQKKVEYKNIEDRTYMLSKMYDYLENENANVNIRNMFEQRMCIDFSYYFQEIDSMVLETVYFLNVEVTDLMMKVKDENVEVFKQYRTLTEKADKKRYAILKEFLTLDAFEIVSHNKFSIIVDDEKYLIGKVEKLSENIKRWCSFYVIGENKSNLKNVKYVKSISKLDRLLNTYIIYNEQFKNLKMLEYLDSIIGQRLINIIVFNKNKMFLNKEEVGEYKINNLSEDTLNIIKVNDKEVNNTVPIFLALENNASSIGELATKSMTGKNNIFYHSNVLYKYSGLLLKYKNSKLVYKLYTFFKK